MGERAIDVDHPQAGLSEPLAKIISITAARGPRVFGSAKGLIHIADDFDAPLEDLRDYM